MIRAALEEVCDYFELTEEEIKKKDRKTHLVKARRAYCWLAWHNRITSQTVIAKLIDRDHATVIHHYRKFEDFCSINDPETIELRNDLLNRWKSRGLEKKVNIAQKINELEYQLKKLKEYEAQS